MGYGLGVFLLALGAILAFAVHDQLAGIDLRMIGYILMAAGALIVVLVAATTASRRRSTAVTQYSDGSRQVTERNDPPPAV